MGDQEPLYVIAAAVVLGGLFARDRRLAGTGAALLAALGAADATKSLTKSLVKRTRPHVFLDENRYETGAGGSEQKPDQSFPSGHMAGSVAFARALSRTYPKAGALCGLASLILGWSRIAKGAHWPLDVVGGGAIGHLSEAITSRVLRSVGSLVGKGQTAHCPFQLSAGVPSKKLMGGTLLARS